MDTDDETAPVRALRHLQRGDWHAAHDALQDDEGADASWVHAHLHRVEGDLANAAYWYRRADRPACDAPLAVEFAELVRALLPPVPNSSTQGH